MTQLRLYFCLATGLLVGAYLIFLGLARPGGWPGSILAATGPLLIAGGQLGIPALYWREVRDVLRGLGSFCGWMLAAGSLLVVVVNYLGEPAWVPRTLVSLLLLYGTAVLVVIGLAFIGYRVELTAKEQR